MAMEVAAPMNMNMSKSDASLITHASMPELCVQPTLSEGLLPAQRSGPPGTPPGTPPLPGRSQAGSSVLGCFRDMGFVIPSCIAAMALACTSVVVILDLTRFFHRTGIAPESPVGWVAILGATFLYGSFGILIKAPAVKEVGGRPEVLQVYISIGVAATFLTFGGILLQPSDFQLLSWWGVLGGCLWPASSCLATVGIRSLGYGVATTVWAGTTICTSFVWGSCVFRQPLRSLPGSVLSLLVLGLGIVVAASAKSMEKRQSRDSGPGRGPSTAALPGSSDATTPKARGLLAMVLGALLNGSLGAPYVSFSTSAAGKAATLPELTYLVSFVIGTAVCNAALIGALGCTGTRLHAKALIVPGALTGFYWASGYICAVYATKYLGNNVGYPLCQSCIIISGLWGILYYGEITACRAIGMYAASVVLILCGAGMLARWAVK